MINKINFLPSFKKVHIRFDDKRTVRNNNELFDTKLKQVILDSELRQIERTIGNKDVFLSNTCTRIDEMTGDKTYELGLTDKHYNLIYRGTSFAKSDSIMAIKSKFYKMNDALEMMYGKR